MKVEYVNAFIKASTEVLNNFVAEKFSVGRPFIRQNPFPTSEIVIILGITGEFKGQAVFSMGLDVAKAIASGMMMGMPVTEIDEMAKSALSELGNMIMGNSATLLFNQGIKIDITPPSLVKGTSIEISSAGMETMCVPLVSNMGNVEFDIAIKV
ncbi:chemotaxis protein CheX [Fusibacter paucivorans]|uniref:Chemotaxis protein CheX n=1 Tax=Fusibacter paucivorans TaxID=76009 RepID=A0ABS5PMJ6_9FIRM|nr:chemotaxis protein CheX [Fusibacter paucivorans]MBS7526403.1 chemotaxis protein CheX [Fusibacter paucivorans]